MFFKKIKKILSPTTHNSQIPSAQTKKLDHHLQKHRRNESPGSISTYPTSITLSTSFSGSSPSAASSRTISTKSTRTSLHSLNTKNSTNKSENITSNNTNKESITPIETPTPTNSLHSANTNEAVIQPYNLSNEERFLKYEALLFTWNLINHNQWHNRYKELVCYKEQHGNILVPINYVENPILGRWVNEQRILYTHYKRNKLEEERKAKMKDYDKNQNFKFTKKKKKDKIITRKRRNNVGNDNSKDGPKNWNNLTDERVHALERVGFEYHVQRGLTFVF
mmetsp:Transcript_2213/g.2992  ORF Transcript_2213/g.2992 Transcript_2213/m.2992 type:complete len:280 (+) Transcript_2213:426-1265(+)